MASQVGIQAVVGHEHVAIISAVFFCCFQIGAGIGAAISGAIWTNIMPNQLRERLTAAGVEDAATIAKTVYGNPLAWVTKNLSGTVARTAVDDSYRYVNRLLCISGLVFSGVCIIISIFLDDTTLSKKRSIDDKEDWATNSGVTDEVPPKLEREVSDDNSNKAK
jgi:SIT family siderophore-iron:H+ symporter-like MFS transporter